MDRGARRRATRTPFYASFADGRYSTDSQRKQAPQAQQGPTDRKLRWTYYPATHVEAIRYNRRIAVGRMIVYLLLGILAVASAALILLWGTNRFSYGQQQHLSHHNNQGSTVLVIRRWTPSDPFSVFGFSDSSASNTGEGTGAVLVTLSVTDLVALIAFLAAIVTFVSPFVDKHAREPGT